MLILREVLGFSASEVAQQLSTSPEAVHSALQRARKALDPAVAPPQRDALRELGDEVVAELVALRALDRGPARRRRRLSTADAGWSMPPLPEWFRGRDDVRAFLLSGPLRW